MARRSPAARRCAPRRCGLASSLRFAACSFLAASHPIGRPFSAPATVRVRRSNPAAVADPTADRPIRRRDPVYAVPMQILRLTAAAAVYENGSLFATAAHHNLLDSLDVDAPLPAPRLIIWSGWFGKADPIRAIFPRDFRTWTPQGWSGLARAC